MDIAKIVEAKQNRRSAAEETNAKVLFVAPSPDKDPSDNVLKYYHIETVYDVRDVPDRSVMFFSQSAFPVLNCIANNTTLFGVKLIVLSGVPGSEYSTEFDSVSWNIERAAYHTLINDIKVAADISAQLAAQSATTHDRERAQFTRESGVVKDFTGYAIAGEDDVADSEAQMF